jgi:ligand-binding SRPBCC domain-containing protein
MSHRLQFEQWVPIRIEETFLFFSNPANLPRIMPPYSGTELRELRLIPPPGIAHPQSTVISVPPLAGAGSEIVTSFRLLPSLPFRATWIARITAFEWNDHFADEQQKGPFKSFHHRHSFEREDRDGVTGTLVRDTIDYEVGFGILGAIAHKLVIRRIFRQMFEYRQKAVLKLLGR